jgi:hypothetical protein
MRIHRIVVTGAAALALAAGATAATGPAGAEGATVTRGEFHSFAAGTGLDIGGHAQMVRSANGYTQVTIHVSGLDPAVTYAAHVHAAPCAVGDADGHYQLDPAGGATPPNEIWPGPLYANGAGMASGRTVAEFEAGPTAVSVVVHRPGPVPNKIACADLA